jgi:cysteinyl-tRNA synthetase
LPELRLYDTRTREVRRVRAARPGRVGIYACGPTVYARIHIGNARPFVVFSLLKRFFEHSGLDVTLVINVTDVNDKIYARPRPPGVDSTLLPAR